MIYSDPSGNIPRQCQLANEDGECIIWSDGQEEQLMPGVALNKEAIELYKLYLDFIRTFQRSVWGSGNPFEIFFGIILSREAFPAWISDEISPWFSGSENDPAKIMAECGARWFWSWAKDSKIRMIYGNMNSYMDIQGMLLNWVGKALQSADHLSIGLLNSYSTTWYSGFVGIAGDIINPSDSGWKKGNGMGNWGNASQYTTAGQALLPTHSSYSFGTGENAFYMLNVCQNLFMGPYKKPKN